MNEMSDLKTGLDGELSQAPKLKIYTLRFGWGGACKCRYRMGGVAFHYWYIKTRRYGSPRKNVTYRFLYFIFAPGVMLKNIRRVKLRSCFTLFWSKTTNMSKTELQCN